MSITKTNIKTSNILLSKYDSLVKKQRLTKDRSQVEVVHELQRVYNETVNTLNTQSYYNTNIISRLFSWRNHRPAHGTNLQRGLYVYGNVGVGKTMLMDLFYKYLPIEKKKRIHFSHFMLDVHKRINEQKLAQPKSILQHESHINISKTAEFNANPIPTVAEIISQETKLLCFDEFQVTDIADAMILRSLFTELFKRGLVIIATSNRQPEELYKHGLQHSSFLPFINVLVHYCVVHHMTSSVDYRVLNSREEGVRIKPYFENKNDSDIEKYDRLFEKFATESVKKRVINFLGRQLIIPESSSRVARFSFSQLCGEARSATDYLQICHYYKVLFISNIPNLTRRLREQTRRFIILIDILYDNKVCLICTSSVGNIAEKVFDTERWYQEKVELTKSQRELIDELQIDRDGSNSVSLFTGEEEIFAARRVISRLHEMQTEEYWREAGVDYNELLTT